MLDTRNLQILGFDSWLYRHGTQEVEVSRLAGGLVFPQGRNPGYAVLGMMLKHHEPGFQDRRIFTLEDLETDDTDALIRWCAELSRTLRAGWYGNVLNSPTMANLETWNRRQTANFDPPFTLLAAPLLRKENAADCFAYAVRRIQERRVMGRSSLEIAATPKIGPALLGVGAECADGKGIEAHPHVAALCFLVAAMDFYSTPAIGGPEQKFTEIQRLSDIWNRRNR